MLRPHVPSVAVADQSHGHVTCEHVTDTFLFYNLQHVIALSNISKVEGVSALIIVVREVLARFSNDIRIWISVGRGDAVAVSNGDI